MNVKHSSKNGCHITPVEVLVAARELMGGVDLDPASCAEANTAVRARRYFTQEDDGLSKRWKGRVWLNPPGGIDDNRDSKPKVRWRHLVGEYVAGRASCALFLGFSIEVLQTTQIDAGDLPIPLDFPFCVPSRRLAFLTVKNGSLVVGKSPTHANVIVWLPPRCDARGEKFKEIFSRFGRVRT